jgi:hypothetical protein
VIVIYREEIPPEYVAAFKNAIAKAVREVDQSKLGYIGLVGSGLVDAAPVHDIDVLVFPSVGARVGESMLAMNRMYRRLDEILDEEEGLFIAPCPRKILQAETNHIIGQTRGFPNKLSTHTLFFPDYRSFLRHNPPRFLRSVMQTSLGLHGDFGVIKERDNSPLQELERYFLIADYQIPLVYDRYPDVLVLQKTEEIIDCLNKHHGCSFNMQGIDNPAACSQKAEELLLYLDKAA